MKYFTRANNAIKLFINDKTIYDHKLEYLVKLEKDLNIYTKQLSSKIQIKKLLNLKSKNKYIPLINDIYINEKNENGKITYSCDIFLKEPYVKMELLIVYNNKFGPDSSIVSIMKITKIIPSVKNFVLQDDKDEFIDFENIIKKYVWIYHDNFEYYNQLF
jgi:hypothetical protein